jgi:hypothetical protein
MSINFNQEGVNIVPVIVSTLLHLQLKIYLFCVFLSLHIEIYVLILYLHLYLLLPEDEDLSLNHEGWLDFSKTYNFIVWVWWCM